MGTCCKENDAFDEYDAIAIDILSEFISRGSLAESAQVVFDRWFGVEVMRFPQIHDRFLDATRQLCLLGGCRS